MSFLDELVQREIITPYDVDTYRRQADSSPGGLFAALASSSVDEGAVLKAKSEYYAVPISSKKPEEINPSVFKYLPSESAKLYQMIPVSLSEDKVLEVAMVDPGSMTARNVLEFMFGEKDISFFVSAISYEVFEQLISSYSDFGGNVADAIGGDMAGPEDGVESLESLLSTDEPTEEEQGGSDDGKIVESAPVTKMVAAILMRAINEGVSDIHIERTELNSKVRYRTDGQMAVALMLPRAVHNAIVARIKILAKLKLDEKRKPQDGRFPAKVGGRKIDFRVSTMPTFYGEKVVMRLLDPGRGVTNLETTGMSEAHIEIARKALAQPYGIVLITGPTGSGKSTTLYSMLSEIDTETKNVISLEDPIEYNIDGVNQSQVHSEIGYTFANGLRSILRQDPDVIMVGEIRDKETAHLAIQAALTGHMVFSTLHTNSAAGVIPRLIDMGVDPYLIAPTLTLAIGQRLVRRICKGGQLAMPIEGSIKMMLDKQFESLPDDAKARLPKMDMLYSSQPTEDCASGTKGRVAVFEMLEVTKGIERIILDNPTELDIANAARLNGMTTIREDALMKCAQGLVPFQEVNTL